MASRRRGEGCGRPGLGNTPTRGRRPTGRGRAAGHRRPGLRAQPRRDGVRPMSWSLLRCDRLPEHASPHPSVSWTRLASDPAGPSARGRAAGHRGKVRRGGAETSPGSAPSGNLRVGRSGQTRVPPPRTRCSTTTTTAATRRMWMDTPRWKASRPRSQSIRKPAATASNIVRSLCLRICGAQPRRVRNRDSAVMQVRGRGAAAGSRRPGMPPPAALWTREAAGQPAGALEVRCARVPVGHARAATGRRRRNMCRGGAAHPGRAAGAAARRSESEPARLRGLGGDTAGVRSTRARSPREQQTAAF